MDLVVEAEAEPLELLEEIQAIVIGDLLADVFRLIARDHGQQATHGAGDDHH